MLRVIGFLIAGLIAVALAWWLAGLPGTVTISLAGLTIETSTSLALVGVATLIVVIVLLLRLLSWLFGSPFRIGRWRARHRRESGDGAVTGALVGLAAGDADRATRESARARRLLGDTPQTLLLAAQSARLEGREDEAATLYNRLAERDDAALLGLRGLFRQAMAREDFATAAVLAGKAETVHPGSPWLREERARLAVRTGDWKGALSLAAPDAPRAAFAVAAADAAATPEEGLKLARAAVKAHPDFAPAALAYARRLREAGRDPKALDVLRDAWARAPQPDLAAAAMTGAIDPAERLRRAQRLVSSRAEHPESRLLLARLSLEAGRIPEARRLVEQARQAGLDQRRVWVLLADIAARDGGDSAAALRRAADAPSDPAWRCEACGTTLGEWRPVCPHCHTAGRVAWREPARAELLTHDPTP